MKANSRLHFTDLESSSRARLRPVSVDAVRLHDMFWEPRRNTNREATLACQYEQLEQSGCLDNFRRVAGEIACGFRGPMFMDSDAYKWLEAAASSAATHPSPELEAMIGTVVDLIAAAQEPDGYLDTYYMFERKNERWSNLRDMHELYCAGHLIQAAVVHFRGMGSRRLLDVAARFADHICGRFGPEESGKRPGAPGHPEIEMALVELWRATGERRYLEQAEFFIQMRGRNPSVCYSGRVGQPWDEDRTYWQDQVPYRELSEVHGHAVRMLYLAAGAADVALETGDKELVAAMRRQWSNMTTRRMYVSGGLGSRWRGEAFGRDYELPSERAYTETCAAIASVMWNHRLLALTGETRFADLIEHTLYNAVLPGLSLDGRQYFYQNPLADDGTHRRESWFGCACCPPNVARLLAQLPGYFYSVCDTGVWIHLYGQNSVELTTTGGREVRLALQTRYPWDGDIDIEVGSEGLFSLFPRIPDWCGEGVAVELNGAPWEQKAVPGTYLELSREWKKGDRVRLHFPMPVRRLLTHPHAAENTHRVALMRGPLLYAVEEFDHSGLDLRDLVLPDDASVRAEDRPDLLGGVIVLRARGHLRPPAKQWRDTLYREAPVSERRRSGSVELTAVPYFLWANREPGRMQVWLRRR